MTNFSKMKEILLILTLQWTPVISFCKFIKRNKHILIIFLGNFHRCFVQELMRILCRYLFSISGMSGVPQNPFLHVRRSNPNHYFLQNKTEIGKKYWINITFSKAQSLGLKNYFLTLYSRGLLNLYLRLHEIRQFSELSQIILA